MLAGHCCAKVEFMRDPAGFRHREELDGSKRGRWREALDCWDLRMWSRRPLASAVTRTYGTWICG
ncbi:hypothetical protein F442_13331 [Phytophthora nicotianae P10297]|uniref:Uncharacterized protein n=1 Tax=Phytophthora nicotianae P10297 TaxID=1317064 RepID=W2YVQ0_PHYNI|nr:hypothetical protein F442_13331 [Phytophthora nicotianae P10297]